VKWDIHVHLADLEELPDVASRKQPLVLRRFLERARGGGDPARAPHHGEGTTGAWVSRLADWVAESQLDRIVVLALDAVFDESGRCCPERTVLHVGNDFVCSIASERPTFLFGASIHPYRKDAVEELERLIRQGACLVKWVPSAQHIRPDDPKCRRFYEAMVHHGVPLLTHTGVEHTLGRGRLSYNHPDRLVPALEQGVKVIAAHCGVRLFLHEPSFFGAWASLVQRYEGLYGDLSAFAVVTRIPSLRRIFASAELRERVLYGSDFPGIPSPRWCWQLGFRKTRELARIPNPLERNVRTLQALGVPDDVFERAGRLLGHGGERGVSH
jgi:uncharacterized protein